jgi:thioredoxin 1
MPALHQFTDTNFADEVLTHAAPVLVDFTAEWCAPCKRLDPEVEHLNLEWDGAVKVGRLDVDQNSSTAVAYGVMTIPTLILFKGGQPVERVVGYLPRARILARLGSHLT